MSHPVPTLTYGENENGLDIDLTEIEEMEDVEVTDEHDTEN